MENKMKKIYIVIALILMITAIGCAPKVVLDMKPPVGPPLKYCNDAVGHVQGAAPWILGGTCCCTPTEEMFAVYQSEGTVDSDMTYDQFLALFTERGIVTDLDHEGCNNLCEDGPHVVFGGHCMCTPTPGTDNYEEVISGVRKKAKVVTK